LRPWLFSQAPASLTFEGALGRRDAGEGALPAGALPRALRCLGTRSRLLLLLLLLLVRSGRGAGMALMPGWALGGTHGLAPPPSLLQRGLASWASAAAATLPRGLVGCAAARAGLAGLLLRIAAKGSLAAATPGILSRLLLVAAKAWEAGLLMCAAPRAGLGKRCAIPISLLLTALRSSMATPPVCWLLCTTLNGSHCRECRVLLQPSTHE
jgi:hypothetical protein